MAEEITTEELNEEPEPQPIERKNLLTLIREWPLSRKIALGAVALISLGVFAIIILQARTADYQLLYANLPETDASSVVSWLKGQKIDFQLRNNGKNIWIKADKLYETRLDLAATGLPSGGGVGFEVFDKQSFALTDFVQKVNYTRALQGELARTVSSLAPVEATRVHLALPEKRLFKNQQKQATASVIVTLAKGRTIDRDQVQGIIHLVAGSVTGLDPDHVKVIDSAGKVLEGKKSSRDDELLSLDMLAYQQKIEHRMEMRAQALLDKTMGKDRAMVRVTATLDFSKVEKTEELFDAEEPVIRSEETMEEASGKKAPGGIPGVQSNLQGPGVEGSDSATSSKKVQRITNYEISKTIAKTINPVGTVEKLSVSVLVADDVVAGEEGKEPTVKPKTAEELDAMEQMVSSALGLVKERGDVINILSMPFTEEEDDTLLAQSMPSNLLYEYLPFVKIGLIFLGVLLFYLFLVRPIIKTMKGEVVEHYKTIAEMEAAESEGISTVVGDTEEEAEEVPTDPLVILRDEVLQNHVPTAFIIKSWLREES